jgi:hypothetical protein
MRRVTQLGVAHSHITGPRARPAGSRIESADAAQADVGKFELSVGEAANVPRQLEPRRGYDR